MIEQPARSAVRNPYLFVVGCPRSGTTLLQRMLNNHPLLAVANDSHFIPRVVKDRSDGTDPDLTPDLVERVRSYKRFYRLELPNAAVEAAARSSRTYSEFVGALYSEYGRLRGKPLAGEKTPDYVRYLPRLHALFPWVRTVHIIRDGRDVALSTLEWAEEAKGPGRFGLWREEPVAVCALWWRRQVETGRRASEKLAQDRYREVMYEDLISRPEASLRGLSEFLELPFSTQMLAYHEGRVRHDPGLSAKKAWLPPTQGLRDWRDQLPERDVELFEALAGELLTSLGYERATSAVSSRVSETATRCQRWWDSEMSRRESKRAGRLSRS